MKKLIKKVVIPCIISIICGLICGKMVYGIYDKKIDETIYGEKIYLIQAGTYKDYDNMVENTPVNNYIYYKDDDGLFKSIIGVTENKDNIEKIKNTYQNEVIITEYYSKDEEINKNIKDYDNKIKESTKDEDTKKLVSEMLNIYKDKKITLTKVTS